MKIVFLDEGTISLNHDVDYSAIKSLGELVCYPQSNEEETVKRASGAETVIVNKVQMTEDVIRKLPDLKHIAVIATGYNNIDLKAAANAGIRVTNVRGYALYTVPQHVFALILNIATRVQDYHKDVLSGKWQQASTFNLLSYPTFELAGKTIGIIGFGTIGRGVARIAEGFDMKILVHTPSLPVDSKYQNSSLDELLGAADIVTLHCPLTSTNRHMINSDTLNRMKSSGLLINTARGELIEEEALAQALKTGRIAGAGLDVLGEEPPKDSPLLGDLKNLIITPHCSWSAREARQRLIDEVGENIQAFAKGQERNVLK